MFYSEVGRKKGLQIVEIGNAAFKTDDKAIGGTILLLVSKDFTQTSPIH